MSGAADEHLTRASARLGTTLRGKYRLDRVLGVGGMAVVYKATHRNEAEFAVKMLHPELSIRDDVRTRFLREGKAANSVKHPGAVLVVDDDVAEDGAAFLVMELLDGAGVEALWEQSGNRLTARAALCIGHQLLDVLVAAHTKGIIHRDIKPANLFVTRDGAVKVLDFGIARARDAAASGANATGTGMLLGTPAFMPPEQALAKASDIDGQTDLWAVGATLFTLLSGHYVHEGENAPQLMVKAATLPARSLATVASGVPAEVVQLVDRALAFEKSGRWPTASTMRDAIGEAYGRVFGERISRGPLVSFFSDDEAAITSTMPPVKTASSQVASAPLSKNVPATLPSPDGSVAIPLFRTGGTTAQPVSSGPVSAAGVPKQGGTRRVIVGATTAVLIVAASVVGWRLRPGGPTSPPAATAASTGSSEGIATTSPPAVPLPQDPGSPIASALPSSTPSAAASPTAPTPIGRGSTKPATSAHASATVAAPAPPPPSTPAAAPSKPTCRTVLDHYDSNYQPIWRQECK